eukprot:c39651_g1_i1 orf=3-215(-)
MKENINFPQNKTHNQTKCKISLQAFYQDTKYFEYANSERVIQSRNKVNILHRSNMRRKLHAHSYLDLWISL